MPDNCPDCAGLPQPVTLLPETEALILVIDKALRDLDLVGRCRAVSAIVDALSCTSAERKAKPVSRHQPTSVSDCAAPLTVGQRIRALRLLNGLTQDTISRANPAIARASIANWERDLYSPRSESLTCLSETLGCDPCFIESGKGVLTRTNWHLRSPNKSGEWSGFIVILVKFLRECGFTDVVRKGNVFCFSGSDTKNDATIEVPQRFVPVFDLDVATKFCEKW